MRVSMSLPETLLEDFDNVLADRAYTSRSKGIRDALNDYILRYKWMNEIEGNRVGVISIIYDYNYKGLMKKIADSKHEFKDQVDASMYIYLTDIYCLEIVAVKGDISKIKELIEKIMRLKGVENVKLISTPNIDSLIY